ncbi:MAG: hypothetical protein R3359_08565 [Marinirhabdus sp.]|nr:hypothetical protein [Marinirhabdus sp.]
MKTVYYLICGFLSFSAFGQIDTLSQKMVAMQDTYQKPYSVGSVYYEKGSDTPYSGILYGKFSNGKYLSIQEYKDGVGNGTWVNYYENGNLKEVGTYRNNLVEGPIKQYREDGSLKAEGTYKHWRKKVGVWRYYDSKGNLTRQSEYGY